MPYFFHDGDVGGQQRILRLVTQARRKSAEHRDKVKAAVKEVLIEEPLLSIRQIAEKTGYASPIVGTAYHQFKRGEL